MKTMVLDIGGTALKSAVFNSETNTLEDIRECPSEGRLGGAHIVELVVRTIHEYAQTADFSTIGISTAGQVDPEDGRIIYANQNVPGYTGIGLGSIVHQEFHVPAYVENDVNAAAIGEAYFGAGRNEQNFVCLAYGTGIGGALYLNGTLYHGSSCSAGEFGAVITHPEDRHPEKDFFSGCYEKYASTTALVEKAMEYDPSLTNGRLIFTRLDDPKIQEILDGWIMEIVYGLVTITHTLNPSCIILGGGILEQPYVLEQIKKKFYEHIMPSFRHVEIRRAELGNKAGLYGAAMLANDRFS